MKVSDATLGEIYLMNQARLGSNGFDLFVPLNCDGSRWLNKLIRGGKISSVVARAGWSAFEIARIEAGIPRFGVDMGETNHRQRVRHRSASHQLSTKAATSVRRFSIASIASAM